MLAVSQKHEKETRTSPPRPNNRALCVWYRQTTASKRSTERTSKVGLNSRPKGPLLKVPAQSLILPSLRVSRGAPPFRAAKRRWEPEGGGASFGNSIVKERSEGMRGEGGRPARRATRESTREPDKPRLPTRRAPRRGATPIPMRELRSKLQSGATSHGSASTAGSAARREESGWTAERIRAGRRPRKRPKARAETPAAPPRVPRLAARTPRSAEPVRAESRRRACSVFHGV